MTQKTHNREKKTVEPAKVAKHMIGYQLGGIITEEFAIIEEAYDKDKPIELVSIIQFVTEKEDNKLIVTPSFQFEIEQSPFLIIKISAIFHIKPESWILLKSLRITHPKEVIRFLEHLSLNTIGILRGVLHEKTRNTEFNKFIIPIQERVDNLKDVEIMEFE